MCIHDLRISFGAQAQSAAIDDMASDGATWRDTAPEIPPKPATACA